MTNLKKLTGAVLISMISVGSTFANAGTIQGFAGTIQGFAGTIQGIIEMIF